jgi:glycosyltransferase involved in cell wall biosynthesis
MAEVQAATIDVITPAFNERDNIPALLAAMPWASLRQVIVVDNGSTDATVELARAGGAIVVHEPRRGYGFACLAGITRVREAPPDIIAFIDADLADDPAGLPALCAPIAAGETDMVIGSRRQLAEPGSLTTTQRFGNWLACALIRWFTGHRYHDLGPMRALRWDALERLDMQDTTWGWTVEMQYKAAAMHMRTLDIHVPYRPRHAGTSKISGNLIGSAKAGWKILYTIAALRLGRQAHAENKKLKAKG